MNQVVKIDTEYGQIRGGWTNSDFKMNFQGALFENDKNILKIEFSVPYSFITKYGEQSVLDEIENSVVGYIKTAPQNLQS